MATLDEALAWRGRPLTDPDGAEIGIVDEIYLDPETHAPEWALVNAGLFGTRRTFVPLRGATGSPDAPAVPFARAQVKDAPAIDADGELTRRERQALRRHYGLDQPEDGPAVEGDPPPA